VNRTIITKALIQASYPYTGVSALLRSACNKNSNWKYIKMRNVKFSRESDRRETFEQYISDIFTSSGL